MENIEILQVDFDKVKESLIYCWNKIKEGIINIVNSLRAIVKHLKYYKYKKRVKNRQILYNKRKKCGLK